MKLLTFALLIGSGAYGQDARLITLAQEAESQAQRVNARIVYELSHPYTPDTAATAPAPPAKLSASESKALHEALARLAACATGKLVKLPDSPLYAPEISDTCLANAATATATTSGRK